MRVALVSGLFDEGLGFYTIGVWAWGLDLGVSGLGLRGVGVLEEGCCWDYGFLRSRRSPQLWFHWEGPLPHYKL